ncbi:MAG: hypothetical protein KJ042_10330, partial [Deltaproteobacteria bacterium]|nr:hypothetical protein [Deltaproteobacteria bacterium]
NRKLVRTLAVVGVLILVVNVAPACREDPDENETTNAERREILCEKMDACDFADDLEIADCAAWAEDLSDWLTDCALRADGCRELAECFNIDEGAVPDAS